MSLPCGSQLSLEAVDDAYTHIVRSIGVRMPTIFQDGMFVYVRSPSSVQNQN